MSNVAVLKNEIENINRISYNLDKIDSYVVNILNNYWDKKIPVNTAKIIKSLNIDIFYEKMSDKIISFMCLDKKNGDKQRGIIIINSDISIMKKRFIIAHNIGHYMIHHNNTINEFIDGNAIFYNNLEKGNMEWEANNFANKLLMPYDNVEYEINLAKKNNISNLLIKSYLSTNFNVSSTVVEQRLKNIELA